jgi:hypothetical protein
MADVRNGLAALFLLAGCVAISYGAWLFHHGAGFITGGVLFIAWVWLVVIDFPTAGRA